MTAPILITDGSVVLEFKGLIWTNRSRSKAAGREQPTLGMSLVVQRLPGVAGREITIEAKLDGGRLRGSFLQSQVDQLEIWRDNGTQLILTFDTLIKRGVIPVNGGINIEPVRQYDRTPSADEVCAGTLTIIEV